MLEIDNLRVEVENRRVLKDVNLTIGGGEVHVLLGPNGSNLLIVPDVYDVRM